MRLTPTLPDHLQLDLETEQYRILQTQVPILYAVLSVNTGILCFSVFGSVSAIMSLLVPGMFAVLIVIRLPTWLSRPRKASPEYQTAHYLRSTTLIAAFVSLGLGFWGVALLNSDVNDGIFVSLFIAFGAISCAYCLASLPRAAFATIFLATTPVILALLTSGVRLQAAAGVNLLLIFLLILRLVVHQYNYVAEGVMTRWKLKALANTDSLTTLPNRRAFIEALGKSVTGPPDLQPPVAVAMIDLDGFKAVNDSYGHAAGDAVLLQAAERIQIVCSDCRMVARLGGDEFATLVVGVGGRELVAGIGQALVQEMSRPFDVAGFHLHLTASVGLASHLREDAAAIDMMARADMALYEVKRGGGDRALRFTSDMGKRQHRRTIIEQSLRETNPRPRVAVVYQPIFNANTREITSFEALARWEHPELGPISPLEFIGVAEETGTITLLSQEIFAAAIQEAVNWPAPIGLSVNLSAVDLCRPSTPPMIMALCDRYGFEPGRLEIEVTETSVLSDFDTVRNQLDILRESGIRISLDDFGSGFASISYLKEITFDRVKIDGELIAYVIDSPKAMQLLQGILQLCSAIGVPTTAERIETEEQLAVLSGLGCDRLQGFLLSKPVKADIARELAAVDTQVRS